MSQDTVKKVALITGANKGIGLATARQLVDAGFHVLLGCRNIEKGKAALLKNFKADENIDNIECLELDLTSDDSIRKAASAVSTHHKNIDVLIHNAGIAQKGDAFDANIVRKTFDVNYYGTIRVNRAFMPLLSYNNPRIIFISSRAGRLGIIKNEKLQQRFLDCKDVNELNNLLNEFITTVEKNKDELGDWPRTAYGMSKVGMSMYARILAKTPECKDIFVAVASPGYVATDMTSHKGNRTPDQGACVITKLVTMPITNDTPSGVFWHIVLEEKLKTPQDEAKWKDLADLQKISWV